MKSKNPEKIEFETFREIGDYDVRQLTLKSPSCFNGNVRIRKYRVTVEPIEEPVEVLQQRLKALWMDESTNHHQRLPLLSVARKLGMTLEDLEAKQEGVS